MSAARRRPGERWLPPPHPDPSSLPVDAAEAFVDGSGVRGRGEAGIGVVLLWGDVVLYECGEHVGPGSVVVADVRAMRRALHVAATRHPGATLTLWSDSRWAVDATNPGCGWNVRDPVLRRLVEAVRDQRVSHPAPLSVLLCRGRRPLSDAAGDPAAERAIRAHNRADELAGQGRRSGMANTRHDALAPTGGGDGGV